MCGILEYNIDMDDNDSNKNNNDNNNLMNRDVIYFKLLSSQL